MKHNSGKTIKVFSVPSHQTKDRTSGVDFARVIQPMTHLNGHTSGDTTFKVEIYDIHAKKQPNWVQIAKEYDVVFCNYTVLDWGFAAMGAPLRGENKKMIMDIDDAVWYVRRDNPTFNQFMANDGKYTHDISCMLDEVDRITTTSPYLRNVICDKTYNRHDKVDVIPNYINLDLYAHRYDAVDRDTITITHFGSTTHFEDLLQPAFVEAMEKLMREFPNIRFLTVGAFIPEFRYKFGPRYVNEFGHIDIYGWIKDKFPLFMEQTDIVVAPLEIDVYNRSKSSIKYLEYSSAKRPGVYQDIVQYQSVIDNGVNGYLAQSKEDWYESLKKLITDVSLRKNMGDAAFATTQEYQIKDHVEEYAKVIVKTIDNV